MAKGNFKQNGPGTSNGGTDSMGFKDHDDANYHQLYNGSQYYNQQKFNIDTQIALQDYVSDQRAPGSLYSPSQILNHALKNDDTLTANEQYMVNSIENGMHNLGYNITATRYARADFMSALGINNYWQYSESQLQQMLTGTEYHEKGFISMSYNDFKNAPANNPFTDKCVKIVYDMPANTQVLMPPKGGGGDLGEIIQSHQQDCPYIINSIKYTGKQGRSGANSYPQIELHVQVDTSRAKTR